jgi:hypothetical protein
MLAWAPKNIPDEHRNLRVTNSGPIVKREKGQSCDRKISGAQCPQPGQKSGQ